MAITRQRFDRIKADWGDHSSWAVWTPRAETEPAKARIGDLSVLDPDVNPSLLDALRPDVILLGLNGSSRGAEMEREPLRNFHDPSRNGQDYKIRDVLAGTPWWGAFMTDVITGHYETRSGEVGRYIRTHPDEVRAQAKALEAKIADLGVADPLLVAFGGAAYDHATEFFGDRHRVIRITHYSKAIARETYRREILAAIDTSV